MLIITKKDGSGTCTPERTDAHWNVCWYASSGAYQRLPVRPGGAYRRSQYVHWYVPWPLVRPPVRTERTNRGRRYAQWCIPVRPCVRTGVPGTSSGAYRRSQYAPWTPVRSPVRPLVRTTATGMFRVRPVVCTGVHSTSTGTYRRHRCIHRYVQWCVPAFTVRPAVCTGVHSTCHRTYQWTYCERRYAPLNVP